MKTLTGILVAGLFLACMVFTSGLAQENQKLAQSGLKFLSVVSDARAAAMGEAMTSLQVGSSALFFNPAGMAEMGKLLDVTASTNLWIADIKHYTFSVAVSPADGEYGVFGLSIQDVNYGEFFWTRVDPASPKGYDDDADGDGVPDIFKLNALALGLGYARQLSDRFSIGGQIRWVHQDLGSSIVPEFVPSADTSKATDTVGTNKDNYMSPFVFDFGVQFKTGIKSLVFGMSIRNFSKEVKYAEEGFQAPLVLGIGISMNMMDLFELAPEEHALFLSVDASHYRDFPEQVKFGLEYRLMNAFFFRGGYVTANGESNVSLGLGVSQSGFAFDYAYTPFGIFGNVQRFTARFSI